MIEINQSIVGQLNQEQFIKGMQRAVPAHQLDQLLRFEIIPNEVLNDVRDDNLSLPPSTRQTPRSNDYTPRSNNYTPGNDTINDYQLRQIAERAAQRNWQNLATKMGFLENDIEAYQMKNRGDPRATVCKQNFSIADELNIRLDCSCMICFSHGETKIYHQEKKIVYKDIYNKVALMILSQFLINESFYFSYEMFARHSVIDIFFHFHFSF